MTLIASVRHTSQLLHPWASARGFWMVHLAEQLKQQLARHQSPFAVTHKYPRPVVTGDGEQLHSTQKRFSRLSTSTFVLVYLTSTTDSFHGLE